MRQSVRRSAVVIGGIEKSCGFLAVIEREPMARFVRHNKAQYWQFICITDGNS
jgi:hypothetical protein